MRRYSAWFRRIIVEYRTFPFHFTDFEFTDIIFQGEGSLSRHFEISLQNRQICGAESKTQYTSAEPGPQRGRQKKISFALCFALVSCFALYPTNSPVLQAIFWWFITTDWGHLWRGMQYREKCTCIKLFYFVVFFTLIYRIYKEFIQN